VRLEQLAHRDDHLVSEARGQDLAEARHNRLVDGLDANSKIVCAHLTATVEVRRTCVEPARTRLPGLPPCCDRTCSPPLQQLQRAKPVSRYRGSLVFGRPIVGPTCCRDAAIRS